jgi:hypothetical protein
MPNADYTHVSPRPKPETGLSDELVEDGGKHGHNPPTINTNPF